MKLYLSSMPLVDSKPLLKLAGKSEGVRVALVPTAWGTYPNDRQQTEVKKFTKALEGFGFTVHTLDLTTSNEQSVRDDLTASDIVWVMGGNTFYLNYYMRQSSFNKVIKDLLEHGLVYAGESAGAVAAGSTLHGIEHLDDPKEAPEVVWDGLKLVDFGIIPHWGWERYGPALEKAKLEMEKYGPITTMGNNQALIIDGEDLEVITVSEQ
jgi:dipeptidase E